MRDAVVNRVPFFMAMEHITASKGVLNWLIVGCVLIFCMVAIGGITRLTDSGLSITEWNVIMGTIPPMNADEWNEAFDQYKQYPQYKIVNEGMSLSEFKGIFFWEYFHRLWGRMMGIVFIVPFLLFYFQGKLKGALLRRTLLILVGGGAIGGLGWFMVKSGLQDRPDVSHYRLAIHLIAAFSLFAYILWTILDIRFPNRKNTKQSYKPIKNLGLLMLVLVYIQIVYGAFVAGLDAGTIYNTFPLMNGEFMPDNVTAYDSFIKNFSDHKDGVQFVHRYFAFVLLGVGIWISMAMLRRRNTASVKFAALIMISVLAIQFTLGIATVLLSKGHVPVYLGTMHQLGALLLLAAVVTANHRIRKAFVA